MGSAQGAISWSSKGDREVCICGVGARTSLGLDTLASSAAVRGGISAVAAHPFFVDGHGQPMNLAYDTELPARLDVRHRIEQLLASALLDALNTCPIYAEEATHCWIGIAEPRPGLPQALDRSVSVTAAETLGLHPTAVHVLPQGHASGLMALQACARNISEGDGDFGIAAGVDSYYDPDTLEWLDNVGRLMSAQNRNGFPPGEAAGVCFLASSAAVKRHRLPVLATVTAASTAIESHPIRGLDVCVGEGLSAVISNVFALSRIGERTITMTYCDLNGERYRSEEFSYALLRTQRAFMNVHNYLSPADCWGDVGAASGPLFASLAVAARQRGYANGPHPLLWAGSESGHRVAVLLHLTPNERG